MILISIHLIGHPFLLFLHSPYPFAYPFFSISILCSLTSFFHFLTLLNFYRLFSSPLPPFSDFFSPLPPFPLLLFFISIFFPPHPIQCFPSFSFTQFSSSSSLLSLPRHLHYFRETPGNRKDPSAGCRGRLEGLTDSCFPEQRPSTASHTRWYLIGHWTTENDSKRWKS